MSPTQHFGAAPHIDTKDMLLAREFDLSVSPRPEGAALPPPRVVVAGGSMGGCCAAIALRAAGCEVCDVYERTPGELPSQGAGLVIQPDIAAFLEHYSVCRVEDVAVRSSGRQYVDRRGAVIGGNDAPQLFSAWDVLHRALRAKVPQHHYHGGCAVRGVEAAGGGVALLLAGGGRVEADLLIGADGPGSLVRAHFCPGVRSCYQGYCGWRGLVPEAEVPPHVSRWLGLKFTVFQGPDFHILVYVIPGERGEVAPGQRRVNWVWYWNHEATELDGLLTDIHGRRHGFSVPRGLLRPEVARARRRAAREALPPQLADLVDATSDIFLQAIHDMLAPSLAFGGRAALVGDAGCILRPHTAAGTTKAAVNAWALARALQESGFRMGPALERYSEAMMGVARSLVQVGVELGTRSQFPEGDAGPASPRPRPAAPPVAAAGGERAAGGAAGGGGGAACGGAGGGQ